MPNNGWKPSRCRDCKRPATARRSISYRGLCTDCACEREAAAIEQVTTKSGPAYDAWRAGMARAVEREYSATA